MSPEQNQRVRQLFDDAIEMPGAERLSFLQSACSDDPEVSAAVERLIRAHSAAGGFLETERQRIGRYLVTRELGRGGMGIVFEAFDPVIQRTVALKVLNLEQFSAVGNIGDVRKRLIDEARLAGNLQHPGIVNVFDAGLQGETPFIAMERVEGPSLQEMLAPGRKLEQSQMLDILRQTAAALDYAHEKEIIHRDVKPANIMLHNGVTVKITDFGIAKIASADHRTSTGLAMGTPMYMSPEQWEIRHVDGRSDQFSLALIAYEMLTGTKPFEGGLSIPPALLIAAGRLPSACALVSELPAAVDRVLHQALAKRADDRFGTCTEFVGALAEAFSGPPELVAPVRRSKRRRLAPRATLMLAAAAFVVFAVVYLLRLRPQRPSERKRIVVADFVNQTGEDGWGEAVKLGLRAQLEQSPKLYVLSDHNVKEELVYMGKPEGTALTKDVALDLCRRTQGGAMVFGSITKLDQYAIHVNIIICQSGDSLPSVRETVSRADALRAIDRVGGAVRRKLGESISSFEKHYTPLEKVTTPSLEALLAYSQAVKGRRAGGGPDDAKFLADATKIDPNFAMAYEALAIVYADQNPTKASQAITRAFDLTHGDKKLREVSEPERFKIEGLYYELVTGERDKAARLNELGLQINPRDAAGHGNLALLYVELGRPEDALRELIAARGLRPEDAAVYRNLAVAYLQLNRLDDADNALVEAERRKLRGDVLIPLKYYVSFLREDSKGMKEQLEAAAAFGIKDSILACQADTEAFHGRLKLAREFTARALDAVRHATVADSNPNYESMAGYQVVEALREAEFGNRERAEQEVRGGLGLSRGLDVQILAALALARAGKPGPALALADGLNKEHPRDTLLNAYWLPTIRAAAELDHANPTKAIELLATVTPYDLAAPSNGVSLHPAYVRGSAYLAARRGAQAASEFQKIIDHRGIVTNAPIGALAYLGLGRAHTLESTIEPGDSRSASSKASLDALAQARAAYERFFTEWKDADPDLLILKQAKAEYATLK